MQSHRQPWLRPSASPVESWVVFGDSLSSSTHPNLPSQMVGLITRFPGHPRATPAFTQTHQLPSEEKIFTLPASDREGAFFSPFHPICCQREPIHFPSSWPGKDGHRSQRKATAMHPMPMSPMEQSGLSRFSFSLQPQQQKVKKKNRCRDGLMHSASDTGVLVLRRPRCTARVGET